MEPPASALWHSLDAKEAARLLETDTASGLAQRQVQQRLAEHGPNELTPRKQQSALARFLLQFHHPLIYILLGATAVTAALAEWIDSGVILAVVLINAVIGYAQESKAVRAIDALSRSMTTSAKVIRDGAAARISSTELVPGDIVQLQSGDKVPADLRLLRVRDLKTDESAISGESVPVEKTTAPLEPDTPLADRTNTAYSGSLVTWGQATGVVVATGDSTEIGRVSELISEQVQLATPLTRKIAHFSKILLYAILALAAVTFLVGVLRGQHAFEMFLAAVALAVAAIPEGLPAAVTITLAIGVGRMARRRAIIRRLPAVETLGSTTVICSDKTGTLTQNQMTVQAVVAAGREFACTGAGYNPAGTFKLGDAPTDPGQHPALIEVLRCGMLCNDSSLEHRDGAWSISGDPTEGALIVAAKKAGFHERELIKDLPRRDSIPFESEHQYMATLHFPIRGDPVMYVKGAVERILEHCENALDHDGSTTTLDKDAAHDAAHRLAARGLRVLAFARKSLPQGTSTVSHDDVRTGLTLLGLQGMIDPPRKEAIAAVRACRSAGIEVKMITGDHAMTAAAVARQLGLTPPDRPPSIDQAVTGRQLDRIPDDELPDTAENRNVFARVAPEQKLRLVNALQSRSHVVAMTGDGVNDAPALRRADIGVAMGITGTEVAKDASDMVLTDDNFASIEAAVEEGRAVFDNLTKFIGWILPTNAGQALVILAAAFAGVTLPILPSQVLWVNMTTAVLLGLTLAFEPKEPGIMTRPPRRPDQPILTGAIVLRMAIVSALLLAGAFWLFESEQARGATIEQARTVVVAVFIVGQTFYLLNCRSLTRGVFSLGLFSNRPLLAGVASMIALQLLFTYSTIMNQLFQSEPIPLDSWLRVCAVGLVIFAVVGAEKQIRAAVNTRHTTTGKSTGAPSADTRNEQTR